MSDKTKEIIDRMKTFRGVILCSVLITTGALKQQNKLSMMEALR